MTDKERKELRALQNTFIAAVKKRAPDYPENQPCFVDFEPNATIQDLRNCLYPSLIGPMQRYLVY